MDWEAFAIGLLGFVCAVGGWLLRELWDAVKSLREDLSELEVKIADNYVKISAFENAVNRVLTAIEKLREDLSRKEDRK